MQATRWVGIDVGKRTMEVRIVDEQSQVARWRGKTDETGRKALRGVLCAGDRVAIEAGIPGFTIAKELQAMGAQVFVLNPAKLAIIHASTKKTDAHDAQALARLIQRFDPDELPVVSIPSESEERDRELVSELAYLKQSRNRFINRLHAIYLRAGHTQLRKSALAAAASRTRSHAMLNDPYMQEALRCEQIVDTLEQQIADLEQEQLTRLRQNDLTPHLFSIPGVGPALAMAFIAYIGDGSRFSSQAQVGNYTGLVPRVDCSGDYHHYGPITKHGCVAIRRVAIQAAWSLVYSRDGGHYKEYYERKSSEIGKKKAIVAIGRKLVVLMYTLVKNRDYYRHTSLRARLQKLKRYKVQNAGGQAA